MKTKTTQLFHSFVVAIFVLKCFMEVSVNGVEAGIGSLVASLLGIRLYLWIAKIELNKMYKYLPLIFFASIISIMLLSGSGVYRNGTLRYLGIEDMLVFAPASFLLVSTIGAMAYLQRWKFHSECGKFVWIFLDFFIVYFSGRCMQNHSHISTMVYFLTVSTLYIVYNFTLSLRIEYLYHLVGLLFGWSTELFRLRLFLFGSENQINFNKELVALRFEAIMRGGIWGTGVTSEYQANALSSDEKIFAFIEKCGALPVIILLACIVAIGALAICVSFRARRNGRHSDFIILVGIGVHALQSVILFICSCLWGGTLFLPIAISEINLSCVVFYFEMGLLSSVINRNLKDERYNGE